MPHASLTAAALAVAQCRSSWCCRTLLLAGIALQVAPETAQPLGTGAANPADPHVSDITGNFVLTGGHGSEAMVARGARLRVALEALLDEPALATSPWPAKH